MNKIDYKVKEIMPNIYAVIVRDFYDRAMLFCRVQEYYESSSNKFRGKDFSIWDFIKWYSKKEHGFNYTEHWSGFNIPLNIALKSLNEGNIETPYDELMLKILFEIHRLSWSTALLTKDVYIIGTDKASGETFNHELRHALYYTDKSYRTEADKITKNIKKNHYIIFKNNLLKLGYANKVINDEIQAYLSYGYQDNRFGKGVNIKIRTKYHKLYSEILKK